MTVSRLEAFDLVAHSEQLEIRLEAASSELSKRPGLVEEKAWLEVACRRVVSARLGIADLLTRALRLPELEPLRADHARILQGAAVDALERLHAGITFAGGNRAPLLEALYWKLKIPALRRCERAEFEAFWRDFEKRLASSYARRMLAEPAYQVVAPAMEQLQRAVTTWLGIFTSAPLGELEAQTLREELDAAAKRLEVPCRQARLLAQAALVPLKDLLESSALLQKPKRRGPRTASTEPDEDTHPLLDAPLPDPAEPSPAEHAELAAAQALAESQAAVAITPAAVVSAAPEVLVPVPVSEVTLAPEVPEPQQSSPSTPQTAPEPPPSEKAPANVSKPANVRAPAAVSERAEAPQKPQRPRKKTS